MKTEELANTSIFEKTDFIAKCTTQWHLYGVAAYVLCHYTDYEDVNGVIAVYSRNGRILIPEDESIFPENCKIRYVHMDNPTFFEKIRIVIKILLHRYKQKNKEIVLLSPNDGWYTLNGILNYNETTLVELDEGLASYNSKIMWIKAAYRESSSFLNMMKSVIQYLCVVALQKSSRAKVESFKLFNLIDNALILNENVNKQYAKVFLRRKHYDVSVPHDKYVLFMTQPLVEDNCILEEDLKEFYDYLQILFSEFVVLFKIHPRDSVSKKLIDKKHILLNEKNYSAEEMYYSIDHKPKYVLGFNSTALISLKLFFGADSIALTNLIIDKIKATDMKEFFVNFNDKFTRYIQIPKSEHELNEIISSETVVEKKV